MPPFYTYTIVSFAPPHVLFPFLSLLSSSWLILTGIFLLTPLFITAPSTSLPVCMGLSVIDMLSSLFLKPGKRRCCQYGGGAIELLPLRKRRHACTLQEHIQVWNQAVQVSETQGKQSYSSLAPNSVTPPLL